MHILTIVQHFSVAPKFTQLPQDPTEATEGDPVMLHCAAEGDPVPQIHWDKDSRLNNLDDPRLQVLTNGSLYIKEAYLSDEGKYGCTAGNSGGLKRVEVQLNVKRKIIYFIFITVNQMPNTLHLRTLPFFLIAGEGYRTDMDIDGYEGSKGMMTKTVTITLGVAAAYMVLVVGLMLYCRYRRRRRKQQYLQEQAEGKPNFNTTARKVIPTFCQHLISCLYYSFPTPTKCNNNMLIVNDLLSIANG